ncbi:MAG TPA: hypothetical protein PLI62_11060 [Spirochaetota bacterium]|nr:hypothetical protein [Spirochaetota bacterium]
MKKLQVLKRKSGFAALLCAMVVVVALAGVGCGGGGGGGGDSASATTSTTVPAEGGLPEAGQSQTVSITGQALGNGMWNLWSVDTDFKEYFNGIDTDNDEGYVLFTENYMYFIFELGSGNYCVILDEALQYTYNSSTGNITLQRGSDVFYDPIFSESGSTGYLGYFNDEYEYEFTKLARETSFNGTVTSFADEDACARVLDAVHPGEGTSGDGTSPGGINITVNYSGSKPVSASNPVVVFVYDATQRDVAAGVVPGTSGTVNVTGLPDGNYYVVAFVKASATSGSFEDLEAGDSHVWYGGAYYSQWQTLSGSRSGITVSGGVAGVIVNLDDSHPAPAPSEIYTTLNGVSASYNSGTKTVTVAVDLDTSGLPAGTRNVGVELISPSRYIVNGTLTGENMQRRGQSQWVGLVNTGGTTWSGTAVLQDINESGVWKVNLIRAASDAETPGDPYDDTDVHYRVEHHGNIMSTYHYFVGQNYSDAYATSIDVEDVTISTSSPDTAGPVLTGVSVSGPSGGTYTVTVSMTDANLRNDGAWAGYLLLSNGPVSDICGDGRQYGIFYDSGSGTFKVTVPDADLASGTWTVRYIQLRDMAGNTSNYYIYDHSLYTGNPFGFLTSSYYMFNDDSNRPAWFNIPAATIVK